jgi:hypothetical protein
MKAPIGIKKHKTEKHMLPILGISRDSVTILQQYNPILELDSDKLATHQVFCLNWQALGRTKVVFPSSRCSKA